MRLRPSCLALLAALLLIPSAGCRREPPPRRFPLTGQVLGVSPDGREITVRHDEVKGFMPAMVMPFKVADPAQAKGRLPGDLVKATLVVTDAEAWLEGLQKTGWAPFPEPAGVGGAAPPVRLIKAGDTLPEAAFIDQDGRSFRLSSLHGQPLLLTFIYTRCPLPDFCPRMDRQFQAVQRAAKAGALPGGLRLISVSFDPEFDTPAVLKSHASLVGADPRIWTFATAPRPEIEAFGARLGLSVIREPDEPVLTHNLRTAVVDREGRLATIFNGSDWTPEEAIAALKSLR